MYYIVSSHNLLNILRNVQHVDDFPQEKKLVYHDEPAMMTNMPETSNSELCNRYEYFDQCYSHCEITYISKSNQGGSRC